MGCARYLDIYPLPAAGGAAQECKAFVDWTLIA
jgi:hypothetical protein